MHSRDSLKRKYYTLDSDIYNTTLKDKNCRDEGTKREKE